MSAISPSTSDLRSSARDHKRDAAHKHKWALGGVSPIGRPGETLRPRKPTETEFNCRRQINKAAEVYSLHSHKPTRSRASALDDDLSVRDSTGFSSDHAPSENLPTAPVDAGVMYSYDASRGPSHGSQILKVALAKAVERFEEKETVRLVRNEYDVLDTDGETVKLGKKQAKNAAQRTVSIPDADEDYEFV